MIERMRIILSPFILRRFFFFCFSFFLFCFVIKNDKSLIIIPTKNTLRLKKDVVGELVKKKERVDYCELSQKHRLLYENLTQKGRKLYEEGVEVEVVKQGKAGRGGKGRKGGKSGGEGELRSSTSNILMEMRKVFFFFFFFSSFFPHPSSSKKVGQSSIIMPFLLHRKKN